MSFTSVKTYVSEELARNGVALPGTDDYLVALMNRAVDIISEEAPVNPTVWTTRTGGGLTAVVNGALVEIRLPSEFNGPIRRVLYDGAPADMADAEDIDEALSGYSCGLGLAWRVEGRLFRAVCDTHTLLEIHACKSLPAYTDANGPDPMSALPRRYTNLPALFVLSMWPAAADSAIEQQRMAKNSADWASELQALKEAMIASSGQIWRP